LLQVREVNFFQQVANSDAFTCIITILLSSNSNSLNNCNNLTTTVVFTLQEQVAQLLQTDCAAGWVSFDQKWKIGTGRQYFADII